MKRLLLVGTLVSAVIALVTSAALAGGTLGEFSSGWPSGPLMTSGSGHGQSADMMGGNSRHPGAGMVGGQGNER